MPAKQDRTIEQVRTEFHRFPMVDGTILQRAYGCSFSGRITDSFGFWRLPHLAPHIWFAQTSDGAPGTLYVSGPTLRSVQVLHPPADLQINGIELAPGALGPVVGARAAALADGTVPLASLWGDEARVLEGALSRQTDGLKRSESLVQAMVDRCLGKGSAASELVRQVIARMHVGTQTVEQLACDFGISSRHLHRLFVGHVGCSPKQAARVIRLGKVLDALARGSEGGVEWSDVAAEQGFSDQSHLIADFRAFVGETPGRFVRRHGPRLRYLELGWLLVPHHSPNPSTNCYTLRDSLSSREHDEHDVDALAGGGPLAWKQPGHPIGAEGRGVVGLPRPGGADEAEPPRGAPLARLG